MGRPAEGAVIQVTSRGLRKREKMLDLKGKYVRELIQETIAEVGLLTVEILQDAAPVRTGALKDSIGITGRNRSVYRPNIRVGIDVVSDEGFPYLNVTRFGRKPVFANLSRPGSVGGAKPARTYNIAPGSPGAQKRPFRGHMLRYYLGATGGGPPIYSRRVKAYRPRRDWIRATQPDVNEMSEYAFRVVTKEIGLVLKSGTTKPRVPTSKVVSRFGNFR